MPDETYRLPDGSVLTIPDSATPAQLTALFNKLSTDFPDSIGAAWSTYGQEEEEDEGNIFGALYQAVENLPRGAASFPLLGAQGIAALISPHKDTAIEKKLRGAKDWLFSGIDPKYRESKIANIGLAVGQMAPMMVGGLGLASLGVGAAVPGMLTNRLGISMGSKAMKLLGGAQGVKNIAAGSLMSIPMHYGQWASGISDYEQRTGQDVSALKELAGFAPATLLGIGEMLPLAMMPGIGTVARKSAGLIGAGLAENKLLSHAGAFLTGAATEAVQESASELGQMTMARALYDDEALADIGSKMWDAGIIGGGAGGIVSVLTNLAIRGSTGGMTGDSGAWGQDAAAEEAIQRRQKLGKDADPDLSVARARTEGMPLADQETLDANRRERLRDKLLEDEATRAEQLEQAQQELENLTEKEKLELLEETGRHQRLEPGDAERLGQQHIEVLGNNELSHMLEHVGDIPHRISPRGRWVDRISTIEKINQALNLLMKSYGMPVEVREAGYESPEYQQWVQSGSGFAKDLEQHLSGVGFGSDLKSPEVLEEAAELRRQYAEAHRQIPVYNQVQRLATAAPIALAEGRYGDAISALNQLRDILEAEGGGSAPFEFSPEAETFVPRWTTPEELEAEVERRFVESKANEEAEVLRAQEAQAIATEEVGATFMELDQLHGKSAEEIMGLFSTGQITAKTYDALLVADRISNVGRGSRNALREFVLRNAEVNNRYSPTLVATAILAGHPDIDTGANTSSELLGERATRAVEILTPSLTPESQALLAQESLSPAEINSIINEVSDSETGIDGFRADQTDNLIYGFSGNVGLYDRVNQDHAERATVWRQNETGQLELTIPDPNEESVTALIQEGVAKKFWEESNAGGLRLVTLIRKVLNAKNIVLNQNSRAGGTEFNSEAFIALLERVTGETNFRMQVQRPGTKGYKPGLTSGQKRALVGHIANLPTFENPTLLPDLSRRRYSPEQAAALLEQLVIAREASKASGKEADSWVEAFPKKTDVSPEEAAFRAEISRLRESPGVEPLDNLDQASQLVRHLVEAGYVTASMRGNQLGASLNENTRPSTVEATEAATDPERAADEEAAVKKSETEKRLVSRIEKVKLALGTRLKHFSLPGLDFMLAADVDSIYGAIEGIIESPENMANSVAMLDGPNAKLWVSLSQIDPDGTRPIRDIIEDLTEEVVHAYDRQGYWYQNELSTMDSRAFDTVVPASVSEQGHKDGLNFVQFAEKLYPNLNQQDTMSEARAKYMTALAKNQIPRGRTAGKVGNLKDKIVSFLTAGIEAGREAEMQEMLSIFNQFRSGEVGRRGPPDPGQPRSLRLSRYADPRHIRELKKAIEEGDTDAQERIAQDILDEKKFDMAQSAPPELTWRDRLFNQFMMDEELANTRPGEIPLIGINASDRAINEYFRQKRGEQPYTMPEAIKHKFRNQEQWAPSEELQNLVNERAARIKSEPELGGEILIDAMTNLTDALAVLHNDPEYQKLSIAQQFKKTREFHESYAVTWENGILPKLADIWRRNIADGAYAIENFGQIKDRLITGVRSLADTSANAAIRWRNAAGFLLASHERLGAIAWIGDPLDGTHEFIEYGPEQETLIQMFAHFQSARDRTFGVIRIAAKRFLDMKRKMVEAQAYLDRAKQEGNEANITFFTQQVKDRPWDTKLSTEEQIAEAEKVVYNITKDAPNLVLFDKSYQAHNKNNLNFMLAKELITPEMHAFLQDMTYLPLYKNIGTMESFPLGSDGRGNKGREKFLQFGKMVDAKGYVFDHALESFDNLEDIDLLRNIMNSEMAMIRDAFTFTAARRVVRDAQELTEEGFGVQSRQVSKDKAGQPNVIRIMVKGQEEYHELADPLLAPALMTLGFSSTNNWLRAARVGAQVTRWGVVNFPAFIYRNFTKDARHQNAINAADKGSLFPLKSSIRLALKPDTLERAYRIGLVSGGGAFTTHQELVGGEGAIQETLNVLGLGKAGQRMARRANMYKKYDQVSADFKEGRMPLRNLGDYFAYMSVMYENMKQIGESTARVSAHDTILGATGSTAEAALAGLEVQNFGRHGNDPLLNAITSMIPFMAGSITGTDAFIRSWTGSPDSIGAIAVDPRMNDEAAKTIRNRAAIRALHAVGALLIYYMMVRDDEGYKSAGEVEKMNNFLIPIGGTDKYFKIPTAFASGALLKTIPESILRLIDEDDYTPADVGKEVLDQTRRNLGFHIMPQVMRPMWYAMQNKSDFTREPIVPRYMEDLPSEYQRTEYTSNSAARLASMFGVLPGVDTLSSPMKMENMIRSYFGQAGLYAMLVSDRMIREFTGQNMVGTRYDWAPSSLLTGEGIENFPVIGDVVGDWRMGRGNVDKFYELKDEVDIYVSVVNKLRREGSPEEVQKWIADNVNTRNYRSKVNAFGTYMQRWRQRRDNLLRSDWISDDRKRELLFDMIEERDRILDNLTSVKAGMKGLIPYNWERSVI